MIWSKWRLPSRILWSNYLEKYLIFLKMCQQSGTLILAIYTEVAGVYIYNGIFVPFIQALNYTFVSNPFITGFKRRNIPCYFQIKITQNSFSSTNKSVNKYKVERVLYCLLYGTKSSIWTFAFNVVGISHPSHFIVIRTRALKKYAHHSPFVNEIKWLNWYTSSRTV